MDELKPTGFETADALDRLRAVRRGMPYKTLCPSDVDEAIEALEDKLNRRPAPENKPPCYTAEKDNPYPLCVGRGMTECAHCCLWMDYEPEEDESRVNKPLTLEQLRQMDGEPVKVVEDGEYQYGIVSLSGHFLAPKEEVITLCSGNFYLLREMVGNFDVYPVAYTRKPEKEEDHG